MLDAIEAGISALWLGSMSGPPSQPDAQAAVTLLAELRAAGISTAEFAKLACVPQDAVEGWTTGTSAAPQWVSIAIRLVALLTPSARRKLLHEPERVHTLATDRTRIHPFSRIEEL
jgi:hypothetical protein